MARRAMHHNPLQYSNHYALCDSIRIIEQPHDVTEYLAPSYTYIYSTVAVEGLKAAKNGFMKTIFDIINEEVKAADSFVC